MADWLRRDGTGGRNWEKIVKLKQKTFVGANRKVKYPYELSELLYTVTKIGLIDTKSLKELAKELEGYKEYLDKKEIDIEEQGELSLNGMKFKETSIKLPTFFVASPFDDTQIEVSIQKQQYGSGVQPMIYFAIPLRSFANGSDFYGRTSKSGDKLVYVFNNKNAGLLLIMFKIFGMASKAHNHDIREILKVLIFLLK